MDHRNVIGVKDIPLTMGGFDTKIGTMDIDYGTGDFKGTFDKNLVETIVEGFTEGLLAVSFYGRPGLPFPKAQRIFQDYFNIEKGIRLSEEIEQLKMMQKNLTSAFHHQQLDGGAKAALEHPLYLAAAERIQKLQVEMTLLI